MTTKREIIDLAFNEIGVAPYNFDRPVEQTNMAMARLNMMMANWSAKGIIFDPVYDPASGIDTDTNAPGFVDEAMYLTLATRLAPEIGKIALPATKAGARRAYQFVLGQYARRYDMSLAGTNFGAGHKRPNYPFITDEEPEELSRGVDIIEGNG